jgi:septal ring factor EnvC (AmiA/AmiB activator)
MRTLEQIQQDYVNVLAKLGEKHLQMTKLPDQIKQCQAEIALLEAEAERTKKTTTYSASAEERKWDVV